MYVGFRDLEKTYDRVTREALGQVLRMYNVAGKLLNGIKGMYVHSLGCVRVKEGVSCPLGFSMYIWMERREDFLCSCMQIIWFV